LRPVIQHALVHRAKLLDAKVAIGDPRACPPSPRRRRRQREQNPARGFVIDPAAVGKGSDRGSEQPAVERRDPKRARSAAGVGEARNRLQGFPEASGPGRAFRQIAKGLDRIAFAVDRMPERNEAARLGEQQEENAIDDRQRLLVDVIDASLRRPTWRGTADEAREQFAYCLKHAEPQ
jgi:hypothetical protein